MIIASRLYVKNSFTSDSNSNWRFYQSPFIHSTLEHFRNEENLYETISDSELVFVNLIKQL